MGRRLPLSNLGNFKHGMNGTRIHNVWINMRQRCLNPKSKAYPHYGGRGIKICKRWMVFDNFHTDMGDPPPKHTLERKNNNKGYNKSNCTWALQKDQIRNKRDIKLSLQDAIEIVKLRDKGLTNIKIGKMFNIGTTHVSKIYHKRLWPEATILARR